MKLNELFAPPTFDGDEEKTYQAVVLNTVIWTAVVVVLFVITGNLLGGKIPVAVSILNALALVPCFLLLFLVRRGQIALASILIFLLGFFFFTTTTILIGTIRTPAITTSVFLVVLFSLQFGKKGAIFATFLYSLTILVLIFFEQRGLLPEPDFSVNLTQWITHTSVLALTGYATFTATKTIKHYLKKSQAELEKRKDAEKVLQIFSRAIEQNPASIVITDSNGTIQNINPKFSELTGYGLEEAKGENPRILKSGEHSSEFYRELWETISSGKEWYGEFFNKKKNGGLYWEKASISPVFNEDGAITHYVAVKEDITEQKKAHEALQEANRQLRAQLDQINELQATLREQATQDSLTGLHNRRYFDEILGKEFARAKRESYPISLVLLDLDNLKTINDTGGHPIGDQALRSTAKHLQGHTRGQDTVCRIGGDEFAIIMPNITEKDSLQRTQEMLASIRNVTLLHLRDKTLHITFSAGIAAFPTHGETMDEVISFADAALYLAKARGRNRVELFTPGDTMPIK